MAAPSVASNAGFGAVVPSSRMHASHMSPSDTVTLVPPVSATNTVLSAPRLTPVGRKSATPISIVSPGTTHVWVKENTSVG